MRELKITTAVLVVLFACQAVFAAFVPVKEADPVQMRNLAAMCDVVQRVGLEADNPALIFHELAKASDDEIKAIVGQFNIGPGYETVTTAEELEKLFPFGVEDTDLFNLFRRASIHLAFYTLQHGTLHDAKPVSDARALFNLFGYGFAVELEGGDTVRFRFIDIYSAEDLSRLAEKIGNLIRGASGFEMPEAGEFVFRTSGLSEFDFRILVSLIRNAMYDFLMF